MRVLSAEDDQTNPMEFVQTMIENNKENVAICREQLHNLIKLNTVPGEIVEIYSEYISGLISEHEFGPVKTKISLSLSQVLTSELLDTEDELFIEIRHT